MPRPSGLVVLGALLLTPHVSAQSQPSRVVPADSSRAASSDPVTRLGEYVAQYYARAQSIVTDETLVIQPLNADLTAAGFPRRAVYELRVEWHPDAATAEEQATAVRKLLKESGPAIYDRGDERCADPPLITPAPLAFLLPDHQRDWNFAMGKPGKVDGRAAMTIEYSLRHPYPAKVVDKECLATDLGGQMVGRVWADPATAEIFRVEERLPHMVDITVPKAFRKRDTPADITFERLQSSVRYKRIAFHDPDEELLLPSSIETLHVHRSDNGASRLRVTHSFANYRRFITGTRLIP
jgi:hypothetical protein